jgi:hypothetical protein
MIKQDEPPIAAWTLSSRACSLTRFDRRPIKADLPR